MDEEKVKGKSFWKNMLIISILIISFVVGGIVYNTYADEKTYAGEFITATKVYMPDNNIKLVIYFNGTESTKYTIFDDWDAKHSIVLSNMDEGTRIKIYYRDYVFRDHKEVVRIEIL